MKIEGKLSHPFFKYRSFENSVELPFWGDAKVSSKKVARPCNRGSWSLNNNEQRDFIVAILLFSFFENFASDN